MRLAVKILGVFALLILWKKSGKRNKSVIQAAFCAILLAELAIESPDIGWANWLPYPFNYMFVTVYVLVASYGLVLNLWHFKEFPYHD